MKKLFVGFLAMIISMHSFAAHVPPRSLTTAIDEFEYDVTVNWDQQDQSYLANRRAQLHSEIQELIKLGLTSENLLAVIQSKVDPQAYNQIKLKLNSPASNNAFDEIMEIIKQSRLQGSAWNGDTILTGIVVVALLALIVSLITTDADPYYCQENHGWVDLNGDGFCSGDEEVR